MVGWRKALALAALSALAACGGDKAEAPKQDAAMSVAIATVATAPVTRIVSATGTIRYRNEVSLGFTTAGKIARLSVQEGDRVSAGQLLAQLDLTTVNADSRAARAELERANAQLTRIADLAAKGWVTKAQLEQAQATQRAAAARTESAGFAAGTASIVAPSSGVILQRIGAPGQVVPAGSAVLVLGETAGGLVLRVPLADADLSRLSPGMPASVTVPALGEQPIAGTVSEVGGRADAQSGTFGVQVALPNNPRLMSGQIANVGFAIAAAPGETALSIPASALFDVRAGEGFVYVVDGRMRVHARKVTVGRIDDAAVAIRSGLTPGERIVAQGHERLVENSLVRPAPATPAK